MPLLIVFNVIFIYHHIFPLEMVGRNIIYIYFCSKLLSFFYDYFINTLFLCLLLMAFLLCNSLQAI